MTQSFLTVFDGGKIIYSAFNFNRFRCSGPALTSALYARFSSRGNDLFANRIQSAIRYVFGGHQEKAADSDGNKGA